MTVNTLITSAEELLSFVLFVCQLIRKISQKVQATGQRGADWCHLVTVYEEQFC